MRTVPKIDQQRFVGRRFILDPASSYRNLEPVARRVTATPRVRALADVEADGSLAALQLRAKILPGGDVGRVMSEATATEIQLSPGQDVGGIKERITSRLHRIEAAAGE